MTVRLPKTAFARSGAGEKTTFHVVIAYEDFAAGQRAMDACKQLVSQLDGKVEFRSGMWKFDILRNAKLNQIAADDAAGADVIIVATSQSGELPPEVRRWVETWSHHKRNQAGVLVALANVASDQPAMACTAHEYLKHAATAAHIEFLPQVVADDQAPVPRNPSAPRQGNRPERIISRPAPEGWGLND